MSSLSVFLDFMPHFRVFFGYSCTFPFLTESNLNLFVLIFIFIVVVVVVFHIVNSLIICKQMNLGNPVIQRERPNVLTSTSQPCSRVAACYRN